MPFDALAVLHAIRDAAHGGAAWQNAFRELDRWARQHYGTGGSRDVVRQAMLIRVSRSVSTLRAESSREAEAWLRRVHRHVAIDDARSHQRAERRLASIDDERGPVLADPPFDPTEPTDADRAAALAAFEDRVLSAVTAHLAATVPVPGKRAGDQVRARAALLRLVHRLEIPAIVTELEPEIGAVSETLLYKWIERGREVLLAALDAHPALAQDPGIVQLREIISERRRDAGRPRPERRQTARQSAAAPDVQPPGSRSPVPRPRKPTR